MEGARIIFCPFTATKDIEDPAILIEKDITIGCAGKNQCVISGPGSHIEAGTKKAKLSVVGFTFTGATTTAVSIGKSSSVNEHAICHSKFE
eukprot:30872-Ditylum_brightwellii.AAC.1